MMQKVSVSVTKADQPYDLEWEIIDEYCQPVVSTGDFNRDDSVYFSLEADKRYFFEITVPHNDLTNTKLFSLCINSEPVLLINSDIEPGHYLFPFYTGVKTDPNKIIGGTNADISDFPWQIYFEAGDYMCGGSIIDENWVITAAHCTKNDDGTSIPLSEMSVTAGATNPYNPLEGREYRVSEVIVHEKYRANDLINDIALLKLEQPIDVTDAKPIKLVNALDVAEGVTDPGVMAWITGWGLTRVKPPDFPYRLQKAQVPIVSNQQAAVVWGPVPSGVIMAGYIDGIKDVCNGDSGGPLVVPVSGDYKLAGIVSWGSENCETYSAYTRVSSFETWVRDKTGLSEYVPPIPVGDTLICQGVVTSNYFIEPLTDISVYEWQIFPEDAGIITGNAWNAVVVWNLQYAGPATIKLRVLVDESLSDWSRLNIEIARNTRILSQTVDTVLCAREPLSLDVEAEGHQLKYEWFKNDSLIASSLSGSFNISYASTENSGDYKCVITGSCGTVSSEIIQLTVHPLTRITNISPDVTVNFGEEFTLDVTAEGHNLTYGWKRNEDYLLDADTSCLVIKNADANDIGLYQVVVTGTCGTKQSTRSYVYVIRNDSPADMDIYLWPTLAEDNINVALETNDSYDIRIYTMTGRLMQEKNNCRYQTTIDVSRLPQGIYIMSIYYGNIRRSVKFIRK